MYVKWELYRQCDCMQCPSRANWQVWNELKVFQKERKLKNTTLITGVCGEDHSVWSTRIGCYKDTQTHSQTPHYVSTVGALAVWECEQEKGPSGKKKKVSCVQSVNTVMLYRIITIYSFLSPDVQYFFNKMEMTLLNKQSSLSFWKHTMVERRHCAGLTKSLD